MDQATITYLSNAGTAIYFPCSPGFQLLVDGLFDVGNLPFDSIPSSDLELLLKGTRLPQPVDYLLFTHRHPDHFSRQLTSIFLKNHPNCQVILPPVQYGRDALLDLLPPPQHASIVCPEMKRGTLKCFSLGNGITVTACNTGHMGSQFASVDHNIFLLEQDGLRILITGDADCNKEAFEAVLGGRPVDAVLVNPLFWHHPQGIELVRHVIRPRMLLLYHVPFRTEDSLPLRRLAQRLMERSQNEPYACVLLHQPFQTVEVPPNLASERTSVFEEKGESAHDVFLGK